MTIAPGARLGPYEVVALWPWRYGRGVERTRLSAVSIAGGSTPQISPPAQLFALPPGNDFYAASADGKRFLVLPETGASPTPVIQVVINWMTALNR